MTTATLAAPGLNRLLTLVRAEIGPADVQIGPTTLAADVPTWNSMAMVNILFGVEDAFGVEFTSEQMERVDGVPRLIEIIAEAGVAVT